MIFYLLKSIFMNFSIHIVSFASLNLYIVPPKHFYPYFDIAKDVR